MVDFKAFKASVKRIERALQDVDIWCIAEKKYTPHTIELSETFDKNGTPFHAIIHCSCGKRQYIAPKDIDNAG